MPPTYPSRWMRGIMDPEENGPDLYPRSKSKDPDNTNGFLAGFRERSYTSGIDLPPSDYDKRGLLDENSIAITNSNGFSTRYYKSPSPQTSSPFNNTSTSLPKTRIDISKTNNKSDDLVYSKRYYTAPSSSTANYTSTSHPEPRIDLPRSYDQSSDDKFTANKESNGLVYSKRYYPSPSPQTSPSPSNNTSTSHQEPRIDLQQGYDQSLDDKFTTNKKSNDLQYSPTRFSPSTSPESSSQFTSTSPQSNATKLRSRTNPASSHVHNNYSRVSERTWLELEQKPQYEQNEFLEYYVKQGKFRDEEVSKSNVKRGEHIFYKGASGALYNHHLLCTQVFKNSIEIIEYSGPSIGVSASFQSVVSSNPMAFGAIETRILTFEYLMSKKAKVRKWPKELQRFSVDEVISRAESRKNERDYHAFDNNCEHFVTWCKCGLNTSLQVKTWYRTAWEGVKAGVGGLANETMKYGVENGIPIIAKAVGNLSDELMGIISSALKPAGFVLGGAIEAGFAGYSIFKDLKKRKKDIISQRQFIVNTIDTCAKAAGHVGGGIAGSIIGSAALVPFGSVIGGVLGYVAGHYAGSGVGWIAEKATKIKQAFQDYVVAPAKKVVKTCVNAVKTVTKTVWNGVKSFFSSLFS